MALLATLPKTEAGFTAVTDNTANTIAADTLDPPTGFTATDGGTITLNWTASIDNNADGYRLFRSTSPGGPYTQIAEVTPRTTVTHQDTPPYGVYYYVARAFDGSWQSTYTSEQISSIPFDCPPNPDLRACIRFDTDVSGTYLDASGNSNTVTHTNGSALSGVSGNAIGGSPTARYEIADSASLDLTTGLTLEAWVRFDSLPTVGRVGVVDNDGQYALIYFAGTGLQCSNQLTLLPHVAVPVGTWFHAACVWDGATLRLYLDGQPVASMASTGPMDATNVEPIAILNTSPLWDEPMAGAIDNLRIWHVARSQTQICDDAGVIGC